MSRDVFRCVWRIKLYRSPSMMIQVTRILRNLIFGQLLCFLTFFISSLIWPIYVCERAFRNTSDVSGVPNYIDSKHSPWLFSDQSDLQTAQNLCWLLSILRLLLGHETFFWMKFSSYMGTCAHSSLLLMFVELFFLEYRRSHRQLNMEGAFTSSRQFLTIYETPKLNIL